MISKIRAIVLTAQVSTFGAVLFLALLIFMAVMATFASDLYVPSLPTIAHSFHITASEAKYTVTLYLLGFALAQLFYGPLSDAYGRRFAVLLGLSIFVIGSSLCVYAQSILILWIGRLIQGLGAAGMLCIARVAAGDVLSGERMSQVISYFSLVFGLIPVIAPMVGAYIQHYYSWHMVFMVMLGYSIVAFIVISLLFPETNKNFNRSAIQPSVFFKNYLTLLKHKVFLGYAVCGGVIFAGIMAYYTLSPFLLQKQLHLSVVAFGWITFIVSCGMFVGRLLNANIVRTLKGQKTLIVGVMVSATGSLLMLVFAVFDVHTLLAVVLPMFIFLMGTGLIFANVLVGVITLFPDMRGAAGALYSSLQMLISFFATLVAAHISVNPQLTTAIILVVLSSIGITFLALGRQSR